MPFVVLVRIPGGPNPDLAPGMRLDSVDPTFVGLGYVKWFDPKDLHLAPDEPQESVPKLNPDKQTMTAPKTEETTSALVDDGGSHQPPPAVVARVTPKKKTKRRKRRS